MKLVNEVKYDVSYIKSHSLQPKWFKVLKVFIIVGFLIGYCFLFGLAVTGLFFAAFVLLSAVVHLVYRAKTNKMTQSWLDFVVEEKDGQRTERIGKFYYAAIVINAILSCLISQLLT
jgi:hypothetical protein